MKFYICNHCGNIIAYVKSSGVPVVCCGEKMQELVPNTTDAAVEKHVPVIQIDGAKVTVTVGSAEHPMIPEKPHTHIAICMVCGKQNLNPSELSGMISGWCASGCLTQYYVSGHNQT